MATSGLCAGQTSEPSEYAIKGAYLYKLGEYVTWPAKALASPSDPFVIGILGADPFGPGLDQLLQGRTVQGHPILLKRFQRMDQIQQVHVLFISADEWAHPEQIRQGLQGRNILTVCDRAPRSEAAISFVLQEGKVRFEIDARAAEREELKLSSKLLSLATAIKRPSSSG